MNEKIENMLTDSEIAVLSNDFKIIGERAIAALQNGSISEERVKEITSKLKSCGDTLYFSDIDYNCLSASAWNPAEHLIRLGELINAYGGKRLSNDEKALKTVIAILDFWLKNDFFCTVNWWYNEIETPRCMAGIGLRLKNELSEEQIHKMDEIIGRGTLRGSEKALSYTGANLTDMMYTTVLHGIFIEDYSLIRRAVKRVSEEIIISNGDKEGIQRDGSYFQHGNLLSCAGSYGTVFVEGVGFFITLLYGTAFSLPDDRIKIFIDSILDGQRYFHRALGTAYFSIGRSAIYADGAWRLLLWADKLSKLDGIYRKQELKNYVMSFSDFSFIPSLKKYFPLSYTLVSHSPKSFMGVRGAHENIVLTEVINRQNLLGYNLSYGSNTCFMHFGDEYSTIGAVWDFSMFPGTTAYHEDDSTLLSRYNNDYNITWGKETYKGTHCGGKTDEKTGLGALYMHLENEGITANRSFIMYDGGMIVLISGLSCSKTDNNKEIRTVLEQCKYASCAIGDKELSLNSGAVTVPGKKSVRNGAFAYYNLGNGSLTAVAKTRHGSYSRTDSAKPFVKQTADVFSLYISHGKKIRNGSFAYAVAENFDSSAPAGADGLPVCEIINTESVQGVLFKDGHYAFVFHASSVVTLQNGITLNAEKGDIITG